MRMDGSTVATGTLPFQSLLPLYLPPASTLIGSFVISPGLTVSLPTVLLHPRWAQFTTGRRKTLLESLLLMGSAEANPHSGRPRAPLPLKPLRLSVLNVRSAVSKAAKIRDLTDSEKLDILALTETWIAHNAPAAVKAYIAPEGFSVFHAHWRAVKTMGRKVGQWKGEGGIAIVYRNTLMVTDIRSEVTHSDCFESLALRFTSGMK